MCFLNTNYEKAGLKLGVVAIVSVVSTFNKYIYRRRGADYEIIFKSQKSFRKPIVTTNYFRDNVGASPTFRSYYLFSITNYTLTTNPEFILSKKNIGLQSI